MRVGSYPQNRWYASLFYDLGGLDAGAIVHYVGQYSNDPTGSTFFANNRKIREWTTLDLVVNYTFHLPRRATEPVPGYAKDDGKNVETTDGKGKNIMPVSTAEYSSKGGAHGSIIPPSRLA